MVKEEILLIANPQACGGKAKIVFENYVKFLKKNQVAFFPYKTTLDNNRESISTLIKLKNFKTISIIGGDGTINIALNSLPNLDFNIHIIPAGTGNDIAKMIYKEINMNHIFNMILNPIKDYKMLDIWKCNQRRFSNGFGAGFDGLVAHRMHKKSYLFPISLKYYFEVLRIIFTYRSKTIEINGIESPLFMVSAANGRVYGSSFNVAPKAIIDDGLLEIVKIKKVHLFWRLLYLPRVQKGSHLELKVVDYERDNKITLSSKEKFHAHLDGEPILESVYHITFDGKIRVFA